MTSFDTSRQDSCGTSETNLFQARNQDKRKALTMTNQKHGDGGSSKDFEKPSSPTLSEMHVKTHLKKVLVDMFCNDECDKEQVDLMFERYGLHDL